MKRIVLDVLLLIVFLLVLDLNLTRVNVHEVLGLFMAVPVIVHLVWNGSWFRTLIRGKWTPPRILSTTVNAGLIASFLLTVVTGILMSHFLFRGLIPNEFARNFTVHKLHIWAPFVMLILIGFHVGLHGTALWTRFCRFVHLDTKAVWYRTLTWLLSFLVIAGGVYGSFAYRIGGRLEMKHMFNVGGDLDVIGFFACYLAIVGMYAILASAVQDLLQRRRKT